MKTEFIQHTIDWYKGENIEGGMVLIWGMFLLIMSLYFYITDKFDSTHQLIIPLLIAGLIWFSAAGFGLIANKNRVKNAKIECSQNIEKFVENEKIRVENYLPTYKYLLIGWSIAILLGLALFNFTHNSLARAIGLTLILFSIMGLIVDLTSEQNATAYFKHIQHFIQSHNQ